MQSESIRNGRDRSTPEQNGHMAVLGAGILASDPHDAVAEAAALGNVEHIIDRLTAAIARHKRGRRMAVKSAIDAGHDLISLKSAVKHGDWQRIVDRLGLPARTARRWMKLAQLGLSPDQVLERGGVVAAINGGERVSWGSQEETLSQAHGSLIEVLLEATLEGMERATRIGKMLADLPLTDPQLGPLSQHWLALQDTFETLPDRSSFCRPISEYKKAARTARRERTLPPAKPRIDTKALVSAVSAYTAWADNFKAMESVCRSQGLL